MKTIPTFMTAALLLIAVGPAGAQNLVVNPEFDTDMSGWGAFGGTWDPADWQGSPSSGSATRTMVTGGTSAPLADQCIDLAGTPAPGYAFSAQVYMPSGQAGTGHAYLSVGWFSSPGCIGWISGETSSEVTATGSWLEVADTIQPPPSAVSLHIGVYLWAQTGGGLQGYADHVVLAVPTIFADGFESGHLGAWSDTTPG